MRGLTFKHVIVKGVVMAIDTYQLIESKDYKALPVLPLPIDAEYIAQLRPRKDPTYVTEALLQEQPIVMLESTAEIGRYFRVDGTHRLIGAYMYLHLDRVPAKYVPRDLWAEYVLAKDVKRTTVTMASKGIYHLDTQTELEPMVFQRSLFADPKGPGAHYERNFPHPLEWSSNLTRGIE